MVCHCPTPDQPIHLDRTYSIRNLGVPISRAWWALSSSHKSGRPHAAHRENMCGEEGTPHWWNRFKIEYLLI